MFSVDILRTYTWDIASLVTLRDCAEERRVGVGSQDIEEFLDLRPGSQNIRDYC